MQTALGGVNSDATVEIAEFAHLCRPGTALVIAAGQDVGADRVTDGQRPVVRWNGGGATWTITGTGGSLVLQGIWLQGADIVLTGKLRNASRLRFVTLDPGSSGPNGPLIGTAIDGMPLGPVHLWVEASISTLTLERCITGPIRTRNGGAVEQTDRDRQHHPGDPDRRPATTTRCKARSARSRSRAAPCWGRAAVHRLEASECILDDVAIAEDTQHGCVRFCA